jgi:hypothetical protein
MRLFILAWKSKNKEKALCAVKKVTDRGKTDRVAKETKEKKVRKAAIEKSQRTLAEIAKKNCNLSSHMVIKKLTGQTFQTAPKPHNQLLFADVAKNTGVTPVRRTAVRKIAGSHVHVLGDMAKKDGHNEVHRVTIEKPTNPGGENDRKGGFDIFPIGESGKRNRINIFPIGEDGGRNRMSTFPAGENSTQKDFIVFPNGEDDIKNRIRIFPNGEKVNRRVIASVLNVNTYRKVNL